MKPEIREQVAQTIHAAREAWHASRRSICGSEHDDQGRTLDQAIADAASDAIFAAVLPDVEAALDELIRCEHAYAIAFERYGDEACPTSGRFYDAVEAARSAVTIARARVLAAVKGEG